MIGISFKIKNEYDNIFYQIFKSINFENYRWDIVQDEIYDSVGKNCLLTEKSIILFLPKISAYGE